MASQSTAPTCSCITCSDEGIPMTVRSLDDTGLAVCVDEAGACSEVDVALVAPLTPGATVIVHAGVAIGVPVDTPSPA